MSLPDLLGFKDLVQVSILSLNALLSLALMPLMKCVLLISLFKNNTVKFCEEIQPIFVQFFAVLGPAEISAPPEEFLKKEK